MKEPVKILYISQEIDPYIKETEISEICRKFPQYTQEQGCEIRAFMPCYGHINERRNQLHEVQRLSGMNIIIDDTDHPLIIKVASIPGTRMQVYFIDNEEFFSRKGITHDKEGNTYEDNDERSIFFVRSVLETIKKLRWTPDIIHCNGWITGLAPLYIKRTYNSDPFFSQSVVIYSIYKEEFETNIQTGIERKIVLPGVEPDDFKSFKGKTISASAFHKIAIDFSDGIINCANTISPDIERYIQKKKSPFLQKTNEETYKEDYTNFFGELCPIFAANMRNKDL